MAKLSYPKKPTLLKYRRKPRPTASNAVLENWLKSVREIDHKNKAKIVEWTKAKKQIDAEKKKAEHLKKAVAGIGAVDYRNLWHKAPPRKKKAAVSGTAKKRKPAKKAAPKRKAAAKHRR